MRLQIRGEERPARRTASARPVAKLTMPISGRVLPPGTEAASSVPTNGSDAGEGRERERQPHEQRAGEAALVGRLFSAGEEAEGMVISKAPSRLRPKAMKSSGDEAVHPGVGAQVARRRTGRDGRGRQSPRPVNSTMMPRQKTTRLHDAVAPAAGLAVEEVRHRDRDHREDAGGEDGGQSEAEGDQRGSRADPSAGAAGAGV